MRITGSLLKTGVIALVFSSHAMAYDAFAYSAHSLAVQSIGEIIELKKRAEKIEKEIEALKKRLEREEDAPKEKNHEH